MRVLLVDPSLFTAPYDAALSRGLASAGVEPRWATRALRPQEEADLPEGAAALTCYRITDGPRRRTGRFWKAVKGAEHALDLRRIQRAVRQGEYDVVHFQWAVLPMLDVEAMRRIARKRPVVLTVHDTTPFNGAGVSRLQSKGFDTLFEVADRLIVHTESAREILAARGVDRDRISLIPHGPLGLRAEPRPAIDKLAGRWRVVLFGRLQSYKGIDLLVEALGLLPAATRSRLEVVVAGDPLMDMAPIRARAAALGLDGPLLRFSLGRLSDQQMADLLHSADTFVFPYRAIEASGVLFLVAGLGKWIVASALGAFVDAIGEGEETGALVPPDNAGELARALADSIGRVPSGSARFGQDWEEIGRRTASLYAALMAERPQGKQAA